MVDTLTGMAEPQFVDESETIYTNRPELAGKPGYKYVGTMRHEVPPGYDAAMDVFQPEIAPGVQYAPEEGWTLESVVKAFPEAFNIDVNAARAIDKGEKTELQKREEAATKGMTLREYLNSEEGKLAAKYGKPPDDWNIPDYSEEGRNRYEQIVFKNIGGNPFQFDPNKEVEKSSSYLPTLFNQVFGGQVLYEDRYKMTKKQRDHWEGEKNKFRAYVYNDAVAAQKKMAQEYDWMMNKFDRSAKEFKAANDALTEKLNEKINAFNPKTRVKREVTIDEFNQLKAEDPNWTRGTPMSGKEDEGASVLDLQRLANYEMKIFDPDNLDSEGRVPTTDLQHANRMRTSLGLPTLEEVAGEKPIWGPVKTFWEEKMPGILGGGKELKQPYEYREKVPSGGRTKEGAQVIRGTVVGKKAEITAMRPKAINPDTGEQYEEGFRAIYTDPDTGMKYRVIVREGSWDYE